MKIFIAIAALVIAAAPQRCAKDEEESEVSTLPDSRAQITEDIKMRQAFTEWTAFCKEADSIILEARVQISEANDCYDDSHTPHRGKLKSAIIKAESRLEKLSNKMLHRREFSEEHFQADKAVPEEIEAFKEDFRQKQGELNESLLELKKLY